MEDILLCVTDNVTNDDQWLHLASNIVEALTYSFVESPDMIPTIHVVASAEACLEIGLGAIGRGGTRTLEGGERRLSPVILIPCRANRSWDFGDALLGKNGDGFKENGALDDLAALGVVERDDMQGWGGYRNRGMEDAIESVIKRHTVENIILVGESRAVAELSNKLSDNLNTQIIDASESTFDGDIEELVSQLQWLHSTDSFDFGEDRKSANTNIEQRNKEDMELRIKRMAVNEAMQLASVFIQLDNRNEPNDGMAMR